MATELDIEMRLHTEDPFPDSIVKGLDYGEVDPVLIGADIYGWGLKASESCFRWTDAGAEDVQIVDYHQEERWPRSSTRRSIPVRS